MCMAFFPSLFFLYLEREERQYMIVITYSETHFSPLFSVITTNDWFLLHLIFFYTFSFQKKAIFILQSTTKHYSYPYISLDFFSIFKRDILNKGKAMKTPPSVVI